ncbi:multicopper oxidase [Zopfia rhizophila CBS 207.26]|uniref:laccase n=1 Tax=Zopfia rhizophila CBS 207.26 TaxID=1314779 RepID=A0A6A6DAL9_9PEZI|nr:multicopper oxidase [Zopfia rhizophila CBS 207.26]
MRVFFVVAGVSLFTAATASPSFHNLLKSPVDLVRRQQACAGNTAADRQTWCENSINTDYHNVVPDTGVIREYWLDLKEATVSPDGLSRPAITFNGTIPGPTLFADWGDTMIVHVKNSLDRKGTSVHWHGLRMNYTNQEDGVASITQCATTPGDTYTYKFRLTQYGTTWYHSHFSLQAWDGAFGGIVINGPASANYEEDKGVFILADWFHQPPTSLFSQAQTRGPPRAPTGLVNGTNVFPGEQNGTARGSRFQTSFRTGGSYLLRLINVAMDTHWKFSIDNHTLTVVAMDLVPIKAYQTNVLSIGIAQRYDVIVTADKANIASDFWLRAVPQQSCSAISNGNDIRGIIHYGESTGTPNTKSYHFVDECVDEEARSLSPVVAKDVGSTPFLRTVQEVTLGRNARNLFRWYVNGSTMEVQWGDPTLNRVVSNDMSWNRPQNVIQLDETNQWAYVIIQSRLALPHPIHLHGHDFHVLAQGSGTVRDNTTLNLRNPPRRDTAMLPAGGHLVMAWETDNPGAWLMHCHIGWHTVQGLALQFVERFSEIKPLVNTTLIQDSCGRWNAFAAANNITVDDSGI